jgi:AsmA-like C-terminal region
VWIRVAAAAVLVVTALLIAASVMLRRANPILKGRVIETLQARFHGRVELESLNVSVFHGIEVSGNQLRIYAPEGEPGAPAGQPLISLDRFSFHAGLTGLFLDPMHVAAVHVSGLQINIPPGQLGQAAGKGGKNGGKIKILVDEIVCDNSRLVIGATSPNKDPKDFEIKHIELHNMGSDKPWAYDAALTNAIPRGEIHASGRFGPWRTDGPGESAVTGHYTFDHADLNTIKGIGGTLSSVGDFKGQLNKIAIEGSTETPDFSLDTANHPVPLHTTFEAIVDGTTGDTSLEQVKATLRNSSFTTGGSVINVKGQGHIVELHVDIPAGQIQDFLTLAVNTDPAVITGTVKTTAKLRIRPGKDRVADRLSMQGKFNLQTIHFSNPQVQDKVDMMSLRVRGKPKEAKPGAQDVDSQMNGIFSMQEGALKLNNLTYVMPGARVTLDGIYSLDGQTFDFRGKVDTDVALSQMVDSRWLSFLLKAAGPLFRRDGGGAEIPVRISGTKSEPKFGLDVLNRH